MRSTRNRTPFWLPTVLCLVCCALWFAPAAGADRNLPGELAAHDEVGVPQSPLGVDLDFDGVETPDDCNDNDDQIYPGAPERCNGLDDDCDTLADEDYPTLGDSCSAGLGACFDAGTVQCSGTFAADCDAVAGTPTPEVCGNAIDDNCDGVVDGGDRYVETVGFDVANDCTDSGTPCATIQHAIDQACPGDTVNVGAGTFNEVLTVNKPGLTLLGQGIGSTTIDVGSTGACCSNNSGVWISSPNVTMDGFTVVSDGLAPGTSPRYGVKVSDPGYARLDGVTLSNLWVEGLYRTGIDLNGPSNFAMTDVTSKNNGGAGIFLLDAENAALTNITTENNPWTGLAVATFGRYAPGGTTGVVVSGTNSFGEVGIDNAGLQIEEGDWNGGSPSTGTPIPISWSSCPGDGADLTILPADFGYMLTAPQAASAPDENRYRFYTTLTQAETAAAGSPDHFEPFDRVIQDADCFGTTPTNFHVFDNGTDTMNIQAAIDAADPGDTVNVGAGTFNEILTVNKTGLSLLGQGVGTSTIDLGSTGACCANNSGVWISSPNVTMDGFTVVSDGAGPSTSPRYGVKVSDPGFARLDGVTLSNLLVDGLYRTGIDLNGPSNFTMTDVTSQNNGGAGIFLLDAENAALSNITTANNPWTGLAVATFGRYAPGGTTGVVISGTNSFGEVGIANGGLQIEEGDWNSGSPSTGTPIPISWSSCPGDGADLTIQPGDFGFMLTAPQAASAPDENRYRFYTTLAQAEAAAAGSPDHFESFDRVIQDADCFGTAPTNFYVFDNGSNTMNIQAAINASSSGDNVNVAAGAFSEALDINAPITLSCANAGIPWNGVRGTETVIDGSGSQLTIDISTSDVTIDGCELVGDGSTYAGVQMFSGGNVTGVSVVNNLIHGMAAPNPFSVFSRSYGVFGVTGSAGARAQISGLSVIGNSMYGIGAAGVSGGAGVYVANITGGSPGSGATVTGNNFASMANGPGPNDIGLGVGILEGADDAGGAITAPATGVLVAGNTYSGLTLGALMIADNSDFTEPNANFGPVGAFLLNTNLGSGPLTTVAEPILVPYAKSNNPTGFPGSDLYTPTIAGAIGFSDPGAVIDVSEGNFQESFAVDKSLTLNGPNAGIDACTGTRGAEAVVVGSGADGVVTIAANNVTIDGMQFDGPTSAGWRITQSPSVATDTVQLLNNRFTNFDRWAVYHNYSGTPGVGVGTNWTVASSEVSAWSGANGTGLLFWQMEDLAVLNNCVTGDLGVAGSRGIGLDTVTRGLVQGNTVRDLTRWGMQLADSFAPQIDADFLGNTIENVQVGIQLIGLNAANGISDVLVDDNTISDVDAIAIWVARGSAGTSALSDVVISNNTVAQDVAALIGDFGLIDVRLDESAAPHGAVAVEGNAVTLSGTFGAASNAHGIKLRGSLDSVTVTGNTLDGGAVGSLGGAPPTSGIYIQTDDSTYGQTAATAVVDATTNTIQNFENGVSVYDGVGATYGGLPLGADVNVNLNSIVANTTHGFEGGTGETADANCNWWGDLGGPGAGGANDAVGNVDTSGWLVANDFGVDADLDGFNSCTLAPGFDCEPGDPDVYPGAPQICDGKNNDCNDDDYPALAGGAANEVDNDGDSVSECAGDCDDADDNNFPGNPEICDGQDNDCNLLADYPDEDTDGDSDGAVTCLDCDDADPANFPGNTEVCDGQDNDCNAAADFPGELVDGDGDLSLACNDCDDADPNNFPGNTEICDGQDNDCSAVVNTSALGESGWFSDDSRADGAGVLAQSTNLISDTLTDDPEATASGSPAADPDITRQIEFVAAPGTVPSGTNASAVHLSIAAGAGGGKSQISHRKDDGVGHAPGSVLAPGLSIEYSWMGDGTATVTASFKLGIKTAEFGSTGVSSRTGENAWDKVLIYEPGQGNGIDSDGTWKTETIDYTTGRWWFFDRTAGAGTIGTPLTLSDMATSAITVGGGPKTIADVYALMTAPGAHITSLQFGIGSGNAGGSVYVNQLAASFYRAGDVTTFGGGALSNPGANFPGELIDDDGDGSLACNDCDDNDDANYPGNTEVCDGQDNNCSGTADYPGETTDLDGDLVISCADCDDSDPNNYPGNTEVCDGQDNDCVGGADFPGETTDADNDGSITCLDCDDTDDNNFPGNPEVCDGQDNDCNSLRDDGLPDGDSDGIGDACDPCPEDPGALTAGTYLQDFEVDTEGWFDQNNGWSAEALRVVSGTDGIASYDGDYHGSFIGGDGTGPFSRFDGYRAEWTGTYTASVFVYLDTSWAAGEGFDYAVASSGSNGAHRRDFIFHVAQDTSTGSLLVAADNNTNFATREDLDTLGNHYVVTASGWYELRHTFRDDGGVLAVDLQLLDGGGTLLFTETRKDASDLIPSIVGGNRYAWFTFIDILGGIEVDNHSITRGNGDDDGDGVCDSDDICPGGDDNVNADGDPVPAFCDCDDNDPNNYPGNTEICDGQDNNCAGELNIAGLGQGGWFSDDTRADGTGANPSGTNLISDTLTDDPEASASGSPAFDAEINNQIVFGPAVGTVPAGTHPNAVNLNIDSGAGAGGKSQISHRKDDGVGHFPGSALGAGFTATYSWMGDGTPTVTMSLKFGIKTSEFGSAGVSSRTGENVWDKVLIYEPGQGNGVNSDGLWKTETIDYTTGKWWFFDRTNFSSIQGTPLTLSDMSTSAIVVGGRTVADVYALMTAPGAHITSVQFGIGSNNPGGNVYVNQFTSNAYQGGSTLTFGGPASLGDPFADFPGEQTDDDFDGSLACNDCDDNDAANYPGNTEICDGQDNDCNGMADFLGETTDLDGDLVIACADCDDGDANNYPGNTEVCDGQDNDCVGGADFPGETTDADNDLSIACLDCDDNDPNTFPGATEICDGLDNDCNSLRDDGLPDGDSDGIGDACDPCPEDPGTLTAGTYLQDFEVDTEGWFDQNNGWFGEALSVASGTDGIVSYDGDYHGSFIGGDGTGPFSRFDGYRAEWTGTYTASVFVYLDTSWAAGEGFDYAVASSGSNGAHRRDFIFHVAQDTSTGSLLVAADNNTNFATREDLDTLGNHYVVTASGWYELRHTFRDDDGVLAVDLQLLDGGGTLLFTETRKDASDLIPSIVGGNRYAWFTFIDILGGIEVDNHSITRGNGDDDGDGVCDSDDICPGGDDNVNVDGDPVPAFCDCDDNDPNNYPGNTEICDGQDNNCAGELNIAGLGQGGWFSDDTRADGTGANPSGTNLISDTLTDDPEASASGSPAFDAEINNQIVFGPAVGTVPAGTHPNAVNLNIDSGAGAGGKSQISHRKDDGVGHFPGSALGAGFTATYSWMGDGTPTVTMSLKFGIKTSEFGSAGVSSRTGENVWDKVLIYEPGQGNGVNSDGLWKTETIDYTTGKWWFFDRTNFSSIQGTPLTLSDMSTSAIVVGGRTVADVYALMTAPGAHITSVQFGIGSNNPGGNVYVNQFTSNAYQGGSTLTFGGPASLGDPFADFPGEQTDDDGDGSLACNDCDDNDDANYPGNTEICDGQDNDCVDGADFAGELIDDDGDLSLSCNDCDDTNPDRYPGNTERCDDTLLAGSQLDRDCDTVLNDAPADDDCDVGNVCRADFCDTDDACAFLASGDCGLAGRVLYNLLTPAGPDPTPGTDSADPARPVEDAAIALSGDTTGSDLTDALGDYGFDPVAGDLTLDATRAADAFDLSALSGQDSAEIAKYSVSLVGLSPVQLVAGDVSDNGLVTSFDASLVQQKVVNPLFLLPVAVNNASDWAFFDTPQTFSPIAADTTGVDLTGVVYGDVTMNWGLLFADRAGAVETPEADVAGPTVQAIAETLARADTQQPITADLTPRDEPAQMYLARAPRRLDDGTVEYVLGLQNADGILAMDLHLRTVPGAATLVSATVSDLAQNFQVLSHDQDNGRAAIAVYGVSPMLGTGEFLTLRVRLDGRSTGFPFKLGVEANEGLIPVRLDRVLGPSTGHGTGLPEGLVDLEQNTRPVGE